MVQIDFKPPYNFKEGSLLIFDKPYEWTSFQLVKKIRNTVNEKVGHAGTLDPLATGLMILCTGKFTKKLESLQGLDKTYTGTIKIGCTTPSYDRETEEENHQDFSTITDEQIYNLATQFLGDQEQIPPMHSAIKVGGKKLYELARKGKVIQREARKINIAEFEITKIDLPFIDFKISCTKGTYIRSIAKDFGEQLGVGGHLYNLRRTRIGNYHLDDAWQLEQFIEFVKSDL